MYPFFRLPFQFFKHRNDPPLGLTDIHVSHHICWPWDLDMWWELNNGRTLTLYDLGRLPLAGRTGLIKAIKANKWGLTVAGSSPRYRRRITIFTKIEMRSRAICIDDKFIYVEQSMWLKNGDCAGHVLLRMAALGKGGIVPPVEVLRAVEPDFTPPATPDWVAAWIDADAKRPWPPMMDTDEFT